MDETFLRSMTDNPNLVPSYVSMTDVNQDLNSRKDLKDVVAHIQGVVEGLLDAETLANSDNYQAFLAYYNNVKMAALRNVPGSDTELASCRPTFRPAAGKPSRRKLAKSRVSSSLQPFPCS
jgi:hypothetical protein